MKVERKIFDALWGKFGKPNELDRYFVAHGPGERRQVLGRVLTREYQGLFLLRIERQENKEPEDTVFTNRDDFNAAVKENVEEFEKRKKKIERQFVTEAIEEVKQHSPPEFVAETEFGKIRARALFKGEERPFTWVGLERRVVGIKVEYDAEIYDRGRWETVTERREGVIEFIAGYLADALRLASKEIYLRAHSGAEHLKHFDTSPLVDKEIGNLTWPVGYPLGATPAPHSPVRVIIDPPERARQVIEERRRKAGLPV